MERHAHFDSLFSDMDDYYLSQSKAFIDLFLAEHGLTREGLLLMPAEKAEPLFKQALEFAAEQICRMESMVRLGQREDTSGPEKTPSRKHRNRLDDIYR